MSQTKAEKIIEAIEDVMLDMLDDIANADSPMTGKIIDDLQKLSNIRMETNNSYLMSEWRPKIGVITPGNK